MKLVPLNTLHWVNPDHVIMITQYKSGVSVWVANQGSITLPDTTLAEVAALFEGTESDQPTVLRGTKEMVDQVGYILTSVPKPTPENVVGRSEPSFKRTTK